MHQQDKTIFLIDDNAANRRLVQKIATTAGYRFCAAERAESGIEMIREEQPDLILMDIGLPGMDGLAATRILKEDPATWSIPIIAFTAFAMKGDREKMLAAGCDDYISKPINYAKFVAKLQEWLPGGGRPE